jgi:hypothetical protein
MRTIEGRVFRAAEAWHVELVERDSPL